MSRIRSTTGGNDEPSPVSRDERPRKVCNETKEDHIEKDVPAGKTVLVWRTRRRRHGFMGNEGGRGRPTSTFSTPVGGLHLWLRAQKALQPAGDAPEIAVTAPIQENLRARYPGSLTHGIPQRAGFAAPDLLADFNRRQETKRDLCG